VRLDDIQLSMDPRELLLTEQAGRSETEHLPVEIFRRRIRWKTEEVVLASNRSGGDAAREDQDNRECGTGEAHRPFIADLEVQVRPAAHLLGVTPELMDPGRGNDQPEARDVNRADRGGARDLATDGPDRGGSKLARSQDRARLTGTAG
jgi:hypothetical protein